MTEEVASDTMWHDAASRWDPEHTAQVFCCDDCGVLPQRFWDAPRTQPPTLQEVADACTDSSLPNAGTRTIEELHRMARAYTAARALMLRCVEGHTREPCIVLHNDCDGSSDEDEEYDDDVSVWVDRHTGAVSLMTEPIGDLGDVWLHAFDSMDVWDAPDLLHRRQGDWISLDGGFDHSLPIATIERLEKLAFGTARPLPAA